MHVAIDRRKGITVQISCVIGLGLAIGYGSGSDLKWMGFINYKGSFVGSE